MGESMKKFLLISVLLTIPAYATTMCAQNDTVAIILDPSLPLSNSGFNSDLGDWWATGSYGTVYGISACLNKGARKQEAVSDLTDTDNNGETKKVVGSEKYGRYCWCKLTRPVSSLWVYINDYGSTEKCVSVFGNCCQYYFHNFKNVREILFKASEVN